jgi:hypothetical protein
MTRYKYSRLVSGSLLFVSIAFVCVAIASLATRQSWASFFSFLIIGVPYLISFLLIRKKPYLQLGQEGIQIDKVGRKILWSEIETVSMPHANKIRIGFDRRNEAVIHLYNVDKRMREEIRSRFREHIKDQQQ